MMQLHKHTEDETRRSTGGDPLTDEQFSRRSHVGGGHNGGDGGINTHLVKPNNAGGGGVGKEGGGGGGNRGGSVFRC